MKLYDKLDPHQKYAVDWAWSKAGCGLFFEQGTGKTWIALGVLERLIDTSSDVSALFVVPLTNLESTWRDSLTLHLPSASVATDFNKFKKLPTPRVLLIHFEGLRRIIRRVKKFAWTLTTIDESQRLNSRNSIQSRCARFLRHQPRRLALSGTPIEQAPMDVWAQMRFIDFTVFGESWTDFDDEYLRPTGYMGYKREFRKELLPRFLRKINPYCLRVELADVMNVSSEFHVERFDLFGDQARLYHELDKEMVAQYHSRQLLTPLRITTQIRLHQIVGGFVPIEDEMVHIGDAKMRCLRRLLESGRLSSPLVVFCRYKPEIEAVARQVARYCKRVEILWGKTGNRSNKAVVRAELNRRFQRGEIDALVCQVKTGGLGIDLFRSRCAVLYSIGYSFIDFEQLKSRLLRRGQTQKVNFHFLCANGTIDEDILTAIKDKSTVSRVVLSRLKIGASKWPKTTKTKSSSMVSKTSRPSWGLRRRRFGSG